MKLHASHGYTLTGSYDIDSGFVHKQQNRCDKRRQAASQLSRAFQRNSAWAWGVQHKADGVSPGGNGGIHVLLACQAADLDAGAGGNQRHDKFWFGALKAARQRAAYRMGCPSARHRRGRENTVHLVRRWAQPPRASEHRAPAASTAQAWSPGPHKSGNP